MVIGAQDMAPDDWNCREGLVDEARPVTKRHLPCPYCSTPLRYDGGACYLCAPATGTPSHEGIEICSM